MPGIPNAPWKYASDRPCPRLGGEGIAPADQIAITLDHHEVFDSARGRVPAHGQGAIQVIEPLRQRPLRRQRKLSPRARNSSSDICSSRLSWITSRSGPCFACNRPARRSNPARWPSRRHYPPGAAAGVELAHPLHLGAIASSDVVVAWVSWIEEV